MEDEMKRIKSYLLIVTFMLCGCVLFGCRSGQRTNSIATNGSAIETANTEQENMKNGMINNPYFPYEDKQIIDFQARFMVDGVAKGRVWCKFLLKERGKRGELWRIDFVDYSEEIKENDKTIPIMPQEKRTLYYYFITKDKIYWIPQNSLSKKEINNMCEFEKITEEAKLICQEKSVIDNNKKKKGQHFSIKEIGNDIRECYFYKNTGDLSEVIEIRKFAFKKEVGIVLYSTRENPVGRDSIELWDDKILNSDDCGQYNYKS